MNRKSIVPPVTTTKSPQIEGLVETVGIEPTRRSPRETAAFAGRMGSRKSAPRRWHVRGRGHRRIVR